MDIQIGGVVQSRCKTTGSDVKLGVGSLMGFLVQSWQFTRTGKRFWDVSRWRWQATARANIWLSRKGKAFNQEANLLSLPPSTLFLPPVWLLMCSQQQQWHFTLFHPCPIMHLGIPWHFGGGVFISVCGGCWPAQLQSCSLSLIISEFINTHLIATLRRDLNHLHTKIAFFCSAENASPLHNY